MIDILRRVPIRLFGYGFAFAEAAKYNFSLHVVDLANNLATGFVIIHVCHSAFVGMEVDTKTALIMFGETLFWEAFASFVIPSFGNWIICRFVADIMWQDDDDKPHVLRRWAPFLVGVAMIPLYLVWVDPWMTRLSHHIFYP